MQHEVSVKDTLAVIKECESAIEDKQTGFDIVEWQKDLESEVRAYFKLKNVELKDEDVRQAIATYLAETKSCTFRPSVLHALMLKPQFFVRASAFSGVMLAVFTIAGATVMGLTGALFGLGVGALGAFQFMRIGISAANNTLQLEDYHQSHYTERH